MKPWRRVPWILKATVIFMPVNMGAAYLLAPRWEMLLPIALFGAMCVGHARGFSEGVKAGARIEREVDDFLRPAPFRRARREKARWN